MEEHLLYKQEVGGSIPSCPDIHMEWRKSILVTEALLIITNELWWHFSTLTKIWNGDGQRMPPYIRINSDDPQRFITINRCCWHEMVMVVVYHYSHYLWWTLNVTTTPILLEMRLLVMVNELRHIYAPIVTTIKDPSQ